MRAKNFLGILMVGMLLASSPLLAQVAQQPKATPPQAEKSAAPASQAPAVTPEPDPRQVLQKMCDYLKSLKEFSFKGEVTDDHTYAAGDKLQFAFGLEGYVKRPDRIRLNAKGDLLNKEFFYDGKAITIYDTVKKVYATAAMPSTIDEMLAKAKEDYGIRNVVAELAKTNLFETITKGVQDEVYVGEGTVFGVKCQHVAFDNGKVVAQFWVEASDKPLLRKLVLTYKDVDFSPQWTMYLTEWNVSPQLADNLFAFSPPQDAGKIDFMTIKETKAPERGQGQPKKKGGPS
ncbi:MAG: DUF2092 domain-containing protein [Desulfobaccales bacterium]|jgi:hypothetical protein